MSNNSSKFSLGVVDAPGLTSALNALGIPSVSGETFRIAAEAVQAELAALTSAGQSTAVMPVIVMDTHFPGKRIWTSRNSTTSSILILRTGGPKVIGPIPSTEEIDLPAKINAILEAVDLAPVPGGDAVVQQDGTIVGANLPVSAPVVVPPMSAQVSTMIAQAVQPSAPAVAAPAPLIAETPMQATPADDGFGFPPAALPSWIPTATPVADPSAGAAPAEFSSPVFEDVPAVAPADELGDYPEHVIVDDSGIDLEAESDRFLLPEPTVNAAPTVTAPLQQDPIDGMRLPTRAPNAVPVHPQPTTEAPHQPQVSTPVQTPAAPFPTTPVVAPIYTPVPAGAFEELLTPASPASAVPAVFPSPAITPPSDLEPTAVDQLEQWIANGDQSAIPATPQPMPAAELPAAQPEWLRPSAIPDPTRQPPVPSRQSAAELVQQSAPAQYGFGSPIQLPPAAPQGHAFGIPAAPASPAFRASDYLPQAFVPGRQDTEQVCFVISHKGGTGKSTTGLAIAQRAATKGLRAVLIDMNRGQGDIRKSLRLGSVAVPSIYDFATSGDPERALLSPDMINGLRHPSMPPIHFGVVLAPTDEFADRDIVPATSYDAMIAFCRAHADLVVVDTQIIEATDNSGLIDGVLIPHLRAGAFAYIATDFSSNGLSNNLDGLQKMAREGVPTSTQVVTVLNDRSPSNDFSDQDINTFAAEFQRYSQFIGVIGFAPDFANAMNVGIVPGDDPIWSPILDKALLHVTGRAEFHPRIEEPRRRSFFGLKGKRR